MIVGIGLDLVDIVRIEKAGKIDRFYSRNFTADEIALFERKKPRAQTVAGNFAAKEAVLKALGCGLFDIPLTDIEVLREAGGRPFVNLYGKAADTAKQLGVSRIHITITHTGQTAAAQAVAEKD